MVSLNLHTPETAHWHALVGRAEVAAGVAVSEIAESYLVFTLIRFVGNIDLRKYGATNQFLDRLLQIEKVQFSSLRDVGDQCLLIAGLFPEHAIKRGIPLSYFVYLGQGAYQQLAHDLYDEGYQQLSEEFVTLVDILQNLRELDSSYRCLGPLQAFELWAHTGSQHAYKILREVSNAIPATLLTNSKH